jgi:DNA-binding CsgD family transcriptional regulator
VETRAASGRAAFERGAWRDAFENWRDATAAESLSAADWLGLALSAYLIRVDDWDTWCARAYQDCLDAGARPAAARCAFWLGFGLMDDGEGARGAGWLGRAREALDGDGELECAERGLLLAHGAVEHLVRGEGKRALEVSSEIWQFGVRFSDPDVTTLGCLGRGQALIELGERADGLALLDEAMVAVAAGELSAPMAGLVSCAAIATCQAILDLARAREWTSALTRWCDEHSDLAPYRGQCLVHRAEVLRAHGAWVDAATTADAACERLAGAPAAGDAWYERAELHRLGGELTLAEEAYRAASRAGRDPQPGLALLRLAQGDLPAALGAIGRAAEEANGPMARSGLLGPLVEITLAAGDVATARRAADDLDRLASEHDAAVLKAAAASHVGAVELAEGDTRAALGTLRRAWLLWHDADVPYEAARVRVLVAAACDALGDSDGAAMELDAARQVFHELGASADLARVVAMTPPATAAGPLTAREVEVLRLVAHGGTNRDVARDLFISEKTVARHLSNVFAKLGLSSRAAATAWAYEHGLMSRRT